jgi:hypothetical protein
MASQISFAGTITITDPVTGTVTLVKIVSSVLATGTVSSFAEGSLIGTSPVTISLPINPTQFVYIRNSHATQTLQVTWTPNGGSSAIVDVLQPGSFLILSEQNLVSGISALSVVANGTATPIDYVLAG